MKRNEKMKVIAGLAIVALLIGSSCLFAYGTSDTVIAEVTKTERVASGSGDSLAHTYLVFTKGETFRNGDSLWWWKFNSSDVQGSLTPGRFKMTVYGWRIPFLSSYRNIVSVEAAE